MTCHRCNLLDQLFDKDTPRCGSCFEDLETQIKDLKSEAAVLEEEVDSLQEMVTRLEERLEEADIRPDS